MRRFFVPALTEALPAAAAHHVAVLRLQPGTRVELFAADGTSVEAELVSEGRVRFVSGVRHSRWTSGVTVAAPLIKGDRQDWLVEKLCELGVDALVPLVTERSVIRELSDNKRERFVRLIEAACKQCGRNVPMRVEPLVSLAQLAFERAVVMDPQAAGDAVYTTPLTLIVGPEGGLTDAEVSALVARGAVKAKIAPFVLRVETAAVAAAAVAMASV